MLRHYENHVTEEYKGYKKEMKNKLQDLEIEINNNFSQAMEASVTVTHTHVSKTKQICFKMILLKRFQKIRKNSCDSKTYGENSTPPRKFFLNSGYLEIFCVRIW
jgi:hypothetical protein